MSRATKRIAAITSWVLILAVLLTVTQEYRATASAAQPNPCVAIGDQSNITYSSLNLKYFDNLTQTFTAKHSSEIIALDIYLANNTDSIIGVDLLSLSDGHSSAGTIIGQARSLINGTGWKTIQFSAPVSIDSGRNYAVKVYQSGGSSLVTMLGVSSKVYEDGIFYVYEDGVRQISNVENMKLKLYMSKGDPARATSSLSSLNMVDNVLRSERDPDNLKYLIIVLPQATTITLTPTMETPADSYLEINGKAAASGAPYTISVNEGINPIDFKVIKGDCSESKTYSVQVVKDTIAPTITGSTAPQPNAAGWFNDDVTVSWSVYDSTSGIDPLTIPSSSLITGEGDNLSVTATVKDKAGNSATATADGIKIDRTAPVTAISAPIIMPNGHVRVTLSAIDTLSGVKMTYYQIDTGTVQTGTTVEFQSDGIFTLKAWSEDVAGNVEQPQSKQIEVDLTAPSFATNYPKTGVIGNNTAEVLVSLNESGIVYYAVLPKDAAAPQASQIKAGTDASGHLLAAGLFGSASIAANTEENFSLTGLTASTAYIAYFAAEDQWGNLSLSATALPFLTKTPSGSSSGSGNSNGSGGGSGNLPAIADENMATADIPAEASGNVALGKEISLNVPAHASDRELRVTIKKSALQSAKDGTVPLSSAFTITLNPDLRLQKPAIVSIRFDADKLAEGYRAALFRLDEQSGWVEIESTVTEGLVSAALDPFGTVALFGVKEQQPSTKFNDIQGHWAEGQISEAVANGIISGYPDSSFRPHRAVTRQEFAVMLMRALGGANDAPGQSFSDGDQIGSWARQAVADAVRAGIISGYEDGSFRPGESITRAEMTAMIVRALRLPLRTGEATSFVDDGNIPNWAKGYVTAAAESGIVSGRSGNAFAPNDIANRGEAAVTLLRLIDSLKK